MPHLHMKNMSLFAVVSSPSFSFKEQLQFTFEKHKVFTLLSSRMSGLVAERREVKKIAHTCLIFSVYLKVRCLFVLSMVDLERTKAYKTEGSILVLFYCCSKLLEIYQFETTPKYRSEVQ